jgi:hypothetical protein
MTEPERSPQTILWKRLDRPGHEAAWLAFHTRCWHLAGTVVVEDEGRPCRLDYAVVCDADWRTLWARVNGWVGLQEIICRVSVDRTGSWRMNGLAQPAVQGCVDVDLGFTPSTNLLPIRRLDLKVGESAPVKAAWIRFPDFSLQPLEQVYRRQGEREWEYESAGGRFRARLEVDDLGRVLRYGDIWVAEGRYPKPG